MWNQKSVVFFLTVGLSIFGLTSCGEDTVDVAFNITFADAQVQALALTGTTARVWYRYSQLGDSVRFQPNQSLPAQETITTDGQTQTRLEFSTASRAGFSVASGASIFLKNVPLGQENTEVGIEFLKTLSDGGIYVVAYGVYRPAGSALTKEQLKAHADLGMTIYSGRSCGRCSEQEFIAPNGAESLFIARCGNGTNALRSCSIYE